MQLVLCYLFVFGLLNPGVYPHRYKCVDIPLPWQIVPYTAFISDSTWSHSDCNVSRLPMMQPASVLLSVMSMCWRWQKSYLVFFFFSLPLFDFFFHTDATGDRLMHFSWGLEPEWAQLGSSPGPCFCSVNTSSLRIWLLILWTTNKPSE